MSSNSNTSAMNVKNHGNDSGADTPAPAQDMEDMDTALDELRVLAARAQQEGVERVSEQGKIIPTAAAIQQLALNLDKPVIIDNKPADKKAAPAAAQPPRKMAASAVPPVKRQKAGDVLREARLAKDWALQDVADELKVKLSHLQAIEQTRYGDLPSRTHAVGFVRNYALLLGLDAEELATRMRQEVAVVLPQAAAAATLMPLEEKPGHGGAMPSSSLVIFCVVLALFVYALGYGFFRPAANTENYPSSLTAALPAQVEKPRVAQTVPQQPAQSAAPSVASAAPASQQVAQVPQQSSMMNGSANGFAQAAPATQPAAAPVRNAQIDADASAGNAILPPPGSPQGNGEADAQAVSLQQGLTQQSLAQPLPQPMSSAASSMVQPQANATRSSPSRIRLQALAPLTVQIFDAEGHMLASRTIAKGEAFFIPDKTNYTMATSNAGALRLQVDGREMPPLGAPEEPMHNIPLNADELLSAMN